MRRMTFDEIMDAYWQGTEEPFERWANRALQLDRFPPYSAAKYLLLAVRNTIGGLKTGDGLMGFPNLGRFSNLLWTLRWAVKILLGDPRWLK